MTEKLFKFCFWKLFLMNWVLRLVKMDDNSTAI
jgi:hypothetical protein